MKPISRFFLNTDIVVVFIFFFLLLCCCSSLHAQSIVIGRTVSTLGVAVIDSALITQGFDFWLEDANARGGILMEGYDGIRHPIHVITFEDASMPQVVAVQYRSRRYPKMETKVSQRHVFFLPGPQLLAATPWSI